MVDVLPEGFREGGGIKLGCDDGEYGVSTKAGMTNITISNCIFNSKRAIFIQGFLANSCINNIINNNPNYAAVDVHRIGGIDNVRVSNILSAGDEIIESNCFE